MSHGMGAFILHDRFAIRRQSVLAIRGLPLKTFVEEIREQCARNGDRPALCLDGVRGGQSVSYGALGQYIDNASARLARYSGR